MVEELQSSDFQPIAFELGFGRNETLPPVQLKVNGVQVSISGFVDRVDGWEHNGRLYVRVMDYISPDTNPLISPTCGTA